MLISEEARAVIDGAKRDQIESLAKDCGLTVEIYDVCVEFYYGGLLYNTAFSYDNAIDYLNGVLDGRAAKSAEIREGRKS